MAQEEVAQTELCSELLASGQPISLRPHHVPVADQLVENEDFARAEELYRAVLKHFPTAECATRGLARITEETRETPTSDTSMEALSKKWTAFYQDWIDPAVDVSLPGLALLLFMLVVARLFTPIVVHPDTNAWSSKPATTSWTIGAILLTLAAFVPLLVSRTSGTVDASIGAWAAAGGALLCFLLADPFRRRAAARPSAERSHGIDRQFSRCISAAGWIFVVAGSIAVFAVIRGNLDPNKAIIPWVAGIAIALIGGLCLAAGRGQKLRLQVEVNGVDNSADNNASRYVIAKMRSMGSKRPEGLEVPEGTDVTVLPEDALTTLPGGGIATALFNALRAVRPAAPWRATLSLVDDNTLTISLTRNRRTAEETTIVSRNVLRLPPIPFEGKGSERDVAVVNAHNQLLTAAAAFLLLALARRHKWLTEGLGGATSWESVALLVLATGELVDSQLATRLLSAAVSSDPGNAMARVALVHQSGRHAPDLRGQVRFAERFDEEYELIFQQSGSGWEGAIPTAGCEALQLRMLFTRAAAWLNVTALLKNERRELERRQYLISKLHQEGADSGEIEEHEALVQKSGALLQEMPPVEMAGIKARSASDWLIRRLHQVASDSEGVDGIQEFAKLMEAPALYLWLAIDRCTRRPPADSRQDLDVSRIIVRWNNTYRDQKWLSRDGFYVRACWLAEFRPAAVRRRALKDLELAVSEEDYRLWARHDPSFRSFKYPETDTELRVAFKKIVGDPPPKELLDLPIFSEHLTILRSKGIRRIEQLARCTPGLLAQELDVSSSTVAYWRHIAQLAEEPVKGAKPLNIGILKLLLDIGVHSRTELDKNMTNSGQSEELYSKLVGAATDLTLVPTREETIEGWRSRARGG